MDEPLRILIFKNASLSLTPLSDRLSADGFALETADREEPWDFCSLRRCPDMAILDARAPTPQVRRLIRRFHSSSITRRVPLLLIAEPNTDRSPDSRDENVLVLSSDQPPTAWVAVIRKMFMRRGLLIQATDVRIGSLLLRPTRRAASIDQDALSLTPVEFDTLYALARVRGRAVSRAVILRETRKDKEREYMERCVDVQISSLRKKLGRHKWMIETVCPNGYRMVESPPPASANSARRPVSEPKQDQPGEPPRPGRTGGSSREFRQPSAERPPTARTGKPVNPKRARARARARASTSSRI